jgi:hypothetical protein
MKVVVFVNPETHVFVSGLCLKHLHNIQDSVSEIIVITAGNHVKKFHQHLGFNNITYIDEQTVCKTLELPNRGLDSFSKQFAILHLDKFIDGDTFLNIDADVIFNQPVKFIFEHQRKFYIELDDFKPYYSTLESMCGIKRQLDPPSSFIADFMIFDRIYLEQLRTQSPAVADWNYWVSVEKNNTSGNCAVSEYETYGSWLYSSHPDVMLLEKSITYDNSMKFHKFNPTQENLDANPSIIPMRNTYDFDIDWTPIYPDWKF